MLYFYGSKIILDHPSNFGQVQILHYGQVQIIKNHFESDQNSLDPTKTIWTVQNHFGPIEGQAIRPLICERLM